MRCESTIGSIPDTDIVAKSLFIPVATAYLGRRPKRPCIANKWFELDALTLIQS